MFSHYLHRLITFVWIKTMKIFDKFLFVQPMLTYNNASCGTSENENGSPADSLLSGEGEIAEDPGDSPETPRDTEEEATLSDEFYSHDTDDDDDQSKRKRDSANSVSYQLILVL